MKNSLCYLILVFSFVAALPLMRAADPAPPAPDDEKKSLRVLSSPDHHLMMIKHLAAGDMEPGTYLGVETSPVSATLTAQLGLQEGAGLVVSHVIPDSPAAAALKQHDILLKLDDQLLIEQRQLAVLIRNHKEGDEVTLTFVRAGKQVTAKVKLAKHDIPKLGLEFSQGLPGMGGNGAGAFPFGFFNGGNAEVVVDGNGQTAGREDVDRMLGLIDHGMVPGVQQMNVIRHGGAGDRSINVTVNTGNSHVVLDDEKGSLDLTVADGKKQLVAKNMQGEQIFSGPINTPEERKALPDDVRGRLEKLEDTTQFSFKTDADFKGAETKVVRPRGQGISIRVPAAPLDREALFF